LEPFGFDVSPRDGAVVNVKGEPGCVSAGSFCWPVKEVLNHPERPGTRDEARRLNARGLAGRALPEVRVDRLRDHEKGASMRCLFGLLFVLTTPLLLSARDDDVHKELKALEGTWKAVTVEAGGKPLAKEPDFLFIVGADGVSIGRAGKIEFHEKISVDPTKNPKTIESLLESGDHKGKKQLGIYKVEGGKWILCVTAAAGAPESDRPKTFETKDARHLLWIFERVKEDKKP
jgi:uncharacterized protein (TIGR03067 family)